MCNIIFVYLEKFLKSIFLHSPRSTFTLGFFGFDITKLKEFKDADIIHIHWLSQGFIRVKTLSKINKPVVWTMRDMWPFTGGSHYSMSLDNLEMRLSQIIQNFKKKIFNKNIQHELGLKTNQEILGYLYVGSAYIIISTLETLIQLTKTQLDQF